MKVNKERDGSYAYEGRKEKALCGVSGKMEEAPNQMKEKRRRNCKKSNKETIFRCRSKILMRRNFNRFCTDTWCKML